MSLFRKVCIGAIMMVYAVCTIPALMGWYNRPVTVLGIPVFMLGVGGLSLLLVLIVLALYLYEDKADDTKEGEGGSDIWK